MATGRVADMTIEELRTFVENVVQEKMRIWPRRRQDRPVVEVLESMRRNIIKPTPGQPSTLEMLREDRDR
jgi:hypothetical protein